MAHDRGIKIQKGFIFTYAVLAFAAVMTGVIISIQVSADTAVATACTSDTDGGDVPNTLGKIMNGSTEVVRDYCGLANDGITKLLAEYQCVGNKVEKKYYECPNCVKGVCSGTPNTECADMMDVPSGLSATNVNSIFAIQPFGDAGLTIYDFSFLGETDSAGQRRWRVDPSTDTIANLMYGTGYYLYNPGPAAEVCLQREDIAQTKFVRRGWNFFANHADFERKLNDFTYYVVKSDAENTCNSTACAEKLSLRDLLTGTAETRRLYTTIPLVINPTATDDSAFRYDRITADNADTYAIPANTDFWVYLFE